MKSIAAINIALPSVENNIEYFSGESLRDYDIVLFDPTFPYQGRIEFSGGGSCLTIEATERIQTAMRHWASELRSALAAGKTVFVILNEHESDMGANGSTLDKKQRTYHTFNIENYQALPVSISVRNTKGKYIALADSTYRGLYDAIKPIAQYRVIFEREAGKKIFTTKDGAVVASVAKVESLPGNIVFLPYFDLEEHDQASEKKWSAGAMKIARAIASQLVAIDTVLTRKDGRTPPPEWLQGVDQPAKILKINETIASIEAESAKLNERKTAELDSKSELMEYAHLLYESGKNLELIIEKSLKLLGYGVEGLRIGDLEIDHVITSPEGLRMIGESEGKDTSAIDISKFRQLESNINEDFEREEIEQPAKGVLFGNGFRFTEPDKREEQFTKKCLVNARRLGTALLRTSDLYKVVVYMLDNPADEPFKTACREAIENTAGEIVKFPVAKKPDIQ